MSDREPTLRCCYINPDGIHCRAPAAWVIVDGPAPEAYTHACTAHVGALLTDAPEHRVYPVAAGRADVARPTIVCLCGSTRFYAAYQEANYRETMAGRIVLTVGFYPHSAAQAHGEGVGATAAEKATLDTLHLAKVALADEILVLNVGGYIGDSTRREIAYARALGKRIRWWEPGQAPGREADDDVERMPV